MSDEKIVLHFALTEDDVREALTAWQQNREGAVLGLDSMFKALVFGVGAGVILVVAYWAAAGQFPGLSQLLAFAVGVWMVLGMWHYVQSRHTETLVDTALDLERRRGKGKLVISGTGLYKDSEFGNARLYWPAVDRIVALRKGISVMSGADAHYVPFWALPDGIEPKALVAQVTNWHQENQA